MTYVFTIVSKNYLHYARNLMAGMARHFPAAKLAVVLCDRVGDLDTSALPFELIELEALAIPHIDRLIYHYTILELNTAIKPFVFSHLLQRNDAGKIIYFDPDIEVYSRLDALSAVLDEYDFVLTPHLTDFLDDDRHPSDLSILQSGTYNLGFFALRRSEAAGRLLKWWREKLLRDCVVDIPRGLFTDQKWMDLVPGIFERVCIMRHPGWNVAYWNLKHRKIELGADGYRVNGEPLVFFHYSGYVASNESISKHQDRFRLHELPTAAQQLFSDYAKTVAGHGQEQYAREPYAFARLPSGLPIPEVGRTILRRQLDWSATLPDLRTAAGEKLVVALFNAPIDDGVPMISRLAQTLYERRPDLQAAFPDVRGEHRAAYVGWFIHSAQAEEKIDEAFVAPLRASFSAVAERGAEPTAPTTPRAGADNTSFFKTVYRVACLLRAWARPLVPLKTRARIRNYLLRKAYANTSSGTAAPIDVANSPAPAKRRSQEGINLIGYLRAESGVGESARATLRALTAAGIPHSVSDYRTGNVSRMEERVDAALEQGLQYDVNLFHINADQMLVARETLGDDHFRDAYRIGFWAWELPNFPDAWQSAFSQVDEVWVPSTFCQNAVALKAPVPVVCMPHSIDVDRLVEPDRARFGLAPDKLVFFTMADMLSVPERKNPLGAVEAFIRAFRADGEDVELVIKISNSSVRPDILAILREHAQRHANIHLVDGYLDRQELYSLIESADVFVSLHRSEGFGLGIAEAMSRAKAIVATGWSGNTDFMNGSNALVVDYRLVQLEHDLGPYRKGETWADPDLDHAAQQMRRLRHEPGLLAALGQQARADCRQYLSPQAVGLRMQMRLERIRGR